MIRYPEPKAYMQSEPVPSTLGTGIQKSGVALQLQQIEHLLNIQEEILGTLNARLNDVLKPLNVPVRGTAEERKGSGNSLLVDQLGVLAERVELHNQRLAYMIESVDL